jgi:signal transduction histidine kinase
VVSVLAGLAAIPTRSEPLRRVQCRLAGLVAILERAGHVRRVLRWLAGLVAILVLAVWGLTEHSAAAGSSALFWPAWVWFALAVPLTTDVLLRWAWRRSAGTSRQALLVWTLAGLVGATVVLIWALVRIVDDRNIAFWPVWPLLALLAVASTYSIIALRNRLNPASGPSALIARIETLTRSRQQAADAQAAELRRIERDLHDGAQARLVALSMKLGRAELALDDRPDARRLVQGAQVEARRAIADLRDLARGIAPPLLSDRGLVAAVRALATDHAADVDAQPGIDDRIDGAVANAAYFLVAEALTNAAKHAHAQHTQVTLRLAEDELCLSVRDDGRGGADPASSGLAGLRARVESVGGVLTIASPAAHGTTLEARFPTAS